MSQTEPAAQVSRPLIQSILFELKFWLPLCYPEQTSLLAPLRSLSWKGNLYHLHVTFRGSACGTHEDAQRRAWRLPHTAAPLPVSIFIFTGIKYCEKQAS